MGVLVIPAAVVALVLVPFGAEALGLWAMGLGLRWILGVAHWVAGLDGARGYVMGPGPWVLPLLSLGFLALVLWKGRLRWGGALAMGMAFFLWQGGSRPSVLISDTGSLVGVMTPTGRALSKDKAAGFIARNWLENDGDGAGQVRAAGRWSAGDVIHLSGKRRVAAFTSCVPGQIVVASVPATALGQPPCDVFDPARLKHTGAIALFAAKDGWQMTTARERAGDRLWTHWPAASDDADTRVQYVRINPTRRP